jgi:tRNA(Phe) wybutosine-synthesizing methylase Tyw3
MKKRVLFRIILFFLTALYMVPVAYASVASGGSVEMADALRSSGKIYVVVVVVAVVFAGLMAYLWRIDKKVSKLEDHIAEQDKKRMEEDKHNTSA